MDFIQVVIFLMALVIPAIVVMKGDPKPAILAFIGLAFLGLFMAMMQAHNKAHANAVKRVASNNGHTCGSIQTIQYSGGGYLSDSSVLVITSQCGTIEIHVPDNESSFRLKVGRPVSRVSIQSEIVSVLKAKNTFLCSNTADNEPACVPVILWPRTVL